MRRLPISLRNLREIAIEMAEDGRPAVIFNIGDDDGSGHVTAGRRRRRALLNRQLLAACSVLR
jgi:hypothetical protein